MSHDLVSRTATELTRMLRDGDVSSREVTQQFIDRIDAVNPALNALVVQQFEQALDDAKRADARLMQSRRDSSRLRGSLLGLPVTIKEMFDVRGMATTVGIQRRRGVLATRDAEVVHRWRSQGAIVLGKTNVPQLGMLAESDNPVFGRTNNPWNLDRTCGGSSGGEAALVSAGASPLGLASDGGGSIRLPAHACGVYGFKPTGGQLPMAGHWLSTNWPSDWAQPGPIASCVDDLVLGWLAMRPAAPAEMVYGEVPMVGELSRGSDAPLRIGVYEQLPELPAGAAVRRAVRLAADALADAGAEIVPFEFPRAGSAWAIYLALFYAEGLKDMRRQVMGSEVDDRIREVFRFAKIPTLARPAVARVYDLLGQPRIAKMVRGIESPVLSADRYCRRLLEMHGYRQHFARQWRRAKLDLLLGPIAPGPAYRHHEFYASYSLIYTGIHNLLGIPAGAIPITTVEADETTPGPPSRDYIDLALQRAIEGSRGLPIGVQLAGLWWNDALVLATMQLLNQRFRSPSPPLV